MLTNPDFANLSDGAFSSLAQELNSESCLAELKIDPYWPKWKTGWWKALVLFETGNFDYVSPDFVKKLWEISDSHYLHFFPLKEDEIPANCDPYRHIICHCALGTLVKFACAKKINVTNLYPWVYDWFIRYQLPDGGYNCDEQAYTKSGKSSIVSTITMLEAGLALYQLTQDMKLAKILHKGVEYLIEHKIFRSLSGKVLNSDFLKLTFPRFYEYDVLRGLTFLSRYATTFSKIIPNSAIEETVHLIKSKEDGAGNLKTERQFHMNEGTMDFQNGEWKFSKENYSFPLLENLPKANVINPYLTNEWNRCKKDIL
jgi:hypothetical protein